MIPFEAGFYAVWQKSQSAQRLSFSPSLYGEKVPERRIRGGADFDSYLSRR
jgi:hypothetical protein